MQTNSHNWRELQAWMAARVAAGICVSSWLVWWVALVKPLPSLIVLLSLLLFIAGLVLWYQAGRMPRLAATSIVIGILLLAYLAHFALPMTVAPYFYTLPILLAALLLGLWPALICAIIGGILIGQGVMMTGDMNHAIGPAALLIAVTTLCLPIAVGLRATLRQAWVYSEQQSNLAHEVKIHRGEVSRLNKSLGLTNALLQRHVRELGVARREAEKARQLKERFAVYVSHELRTPLNIILGFLEIMQGYPETYGEVRWTAALRQDIAEIRNSARYLSELVNDLLDLARIDALKMPLRRELTQIEEIVQEAVEISQRLLQHKSVQMLVELEAALPPIFIDRTRIRQVLLNLLANAGRFTEEGEICIRAQRTQQGVLIAVVDTGPGIPEGQLSSLFQDYQQIALEGSAPRDGKGLGLAIAKQFVQLHGGEIWAESQVGQGSAFYFCLPLEEIQIGRLQPSQEMNENYLGHATHVLVVDLDDAAAAYLRRRLEGYAISSAAGWEEAQELVHKFHPQALLYNVAPGAVSFDQTAAAAVLQAGVPILQCSLPVGSWLVEQDIFDAWLVKPISSERLLLTIQEHCAPGGHLLLVDDDRSFIQLVRRILQADGNRYHLHWVHDGEEALLHLGNHTYELILLDIALPLRNGRSVAQAIRTDEKWKNVPVVAISGYLPGYSNMPVRPYTFTVTVENEFSESELLGLVQATLQQVAPRYGNLSQLAGWTVAPDVTAASAESPQPPAQMPILGH